MALVKSKDLRHLSDKELEARKMDLKRKQLNMRFQTATGQFTKSDSMRQARRELAKVETILTDRRKAKSAS